MMERFITANGINLHLLEYPNPAAESLLLLHGLSANAATFGGLLAAGLDQYGQVLAVDLRGRGQSDAPAAGYTMADHAADLVALLDALDLTQITLVGHSFGGLLALFMAARHPSCVRRIVVMDASIATAQPKTAAIIRPSLARLEQTYPSWEAYRDLMRQAPYLQGSWNPQLEAYYRADVRDLPDGRVAPRARPDAIAAALDGTLIEDWQTIVQQISCPALFINAPAGYGAAQAAPVVPPEDIQATAALLGSPVRSVPGNHMTMLFGDGARATVAAIGTFLRQP